MSITINQVHLDVSRLPLVRPFGFKGSYYTEKWLCHVTLQSKNDHKAVGMGGLAILWSDDRVFSSHTEVGGNMLMVNILEYALQLSKGIAFETPGDLLDALLDPVYVYAKTITHQHDLRKTFVLNALVALDNAAWLLYAQENNIITFDNLIPQEVKPAQSYRHTKLACIPLVTYGLTLDEIGELVEAGHFFLKIKIGAPGDVKTMLEADKKRIEDIHKCIGTCSTSHTTDGRIRYYLDANGRYPDKQTLIQLVDHAKKIDMIDQISILEEPFNEQHSEDVHGLGVCVAADESLHDSVDVEQRAALGYTAIALKPAGKTLSMTFRMLAAADRAGLSCFVADSTCPPLLVEWNKNVAARLKPLSGIKTGLLESNGPQFYQDWDALMACDLPQNATWIKPDSGIFHLNSNYYQKNRRCFLM